MKVNMPKNNLLLFVWSERAPTIGLMSNETSKANESVYPTVASVPFNLVIIHKGKNNPVTPALNKVFPISYITHEIIDRFIIFYYYREWEGIEPNASIIESKPTELKSVKPTRAYSLPNIFKK